MKRSLVAILTLVYFAVSSGIVMNAHYCMGRLASVKLDVLGAKACACGKSEKKKCCKTELKVFKIEDTQKAASAAYAIQAPVALIADIPGVYNMPLYHVPEQLLSNDHSPPLLSEQDIYLRYGVLRI